MMTLLRYHFLVVLENNVSNKGGLASHYHGGFTIARGKYLVKNEKIRNGMEGRSDFECLLLLLLAFAFYKKLYSFGTSVCFFFLLSSSFIGVD